MVHYESGGRQQGLCSLGSTWRERGGLAFLKPVSPLSLHFVYNVVSLLDEAELNLKGKQNAMWSTNKCDVLGKKIKGNICLNRRKPPPMSSVVMVYSFCTLFYITLSFVNMSQAHISALKRRFVKLGFSRPILCYQRHTNLMPPCWKPEKILRAACSVETFSWTTLIWLKWKWGLVLPSISLSVLWYGCDILTVFTMLCWI